MFTQKFARLTVLVVASMVASASAFAAEIDANSIAARMQTRFQAIHKLRTESKVAEYANGKLGQLPEEAGPGIQLTSEEKDHFENENKDRESLYGLLAAESGTPEGEIGKLRAELMREQIGIGKAGGDTVAVKNGDYAPFWVQFPAPDGTLKWLHPPLPQDAIPRWVLTAPNAVLYDEKGGMLEPAIGVFEPYKVKEMKRQTGGEKWFSVDFGEKVGWFKEADVLPWDHRLVAAYKNISGRSPVCFFRVEESIDKLAGLAAKERELKLNEMEKSFKSKPGAAELVAMEPTIAPVLRNHPYLMPIIRSGKDHIIKGKPLATGGDDPTFRAKSYEMASSTGMPIGVKQEVLSKPKLDLVFVMDTTGSMQPYIDQLLEQMRRIAAELNTLDATGDRFRFAFWGYRDLTSKKDIVYNTQLFTPEMVTAEQLASVLAEVKANKKTLDEYEEDVLSGLDAGISRTPWRKDNDVIRIIIHCGDAPPLPPTKSNRTPSECRKSEIEVRRLADQRPISMVSIQIRNPRYSRYDEAADRAFGVLTKNRGMDRAAILKVEADNERAFAEMLEVVVKDGVIDFICKREEVPESHDRNQEDGPTMPEPPEPMPDSSPQVVMREVMEGAFDDFQGATNPGAPPRFLRCWALDRDWSGDNASALDIQVVLSRKELNNLQTTLDNLVNRAKEDSQPKEFTSLRDAVAKAIAAVFLDLPKDPTGYQLARLPVKSRVLAMSDAMWASMSPDERANDIESWVRLLKYYQSLYDDLSFWFVPNQNVRGEDKWWINIPLEMFP